MAVCPVDAIRKRDSDGIVVVDREICPGGAECDRWCLDACPYDAPQFEAEENAKMQKCDFCMGRWAEGKGPICVAACPTRALDAGPLDQITAKYGDVREAVGFAYRERVRPSIVFKPKAEVCPEVSVL
jgi:anaerobic dimethyl sulfoxide reductase subunit B (iron-sulfur subunit)